MAERSALSHRRLFASLLLLSLICFAPNLIAADASSAMLTADSSAMPSGDAAAAPAPEPAPKSDPAWQPDPHKLKIVVYPIEGWAPVLGASFKLPDTGGTPGGGSGSTNLSINGAALFGFTIQKDRWYGDAEFQYAGLNGSRISPFVKYSVAGKFAGGLVGFDFWKDFYITGGFRYFGLPYSLTLGKFEPFHRTPSVVDPLVGLMWNRQVSRKWTLNAQFQGGGFGVGTDQDISLVGKADWQFARHFGLMAGYGLLHFELTNTVLGKTLTVRQTLNGPEFGFGIYF